MKKAGFVIFTGILFAGISFGSLCFAEDMPATMEQGPGMMKMQGKMKDGKMDQKRAMMMKRMMKPTLVATSDGGVVVVTGNKITKYDQDLNLVKEADLKMDPMGMMMNMKNCPMMKANQQMMSSEAPAPEGPKPPDVVAMGKVTPESEN